MDVLVILVLLMILAAVVFLFIAPWWIVFKKAGRPGWAILVPVYNMIVQLQVAKLNPWLVILLLIPIVNLVMSIIMTCKICKAFNRGVGFIFGMIFLPVIFLPILAYGGSQYQFDEAEC